MLFPVLAVNDGVAGPEFAGEPQWLRLPVRFRWTNLTFPNNELFRITNKCYSNDAARPIIWYDSGVVQAGDILPNEEVLT